MAAWNRLTRALVASLVTATCHADAPASAPAATSAPAAAASAPADELIPGFRNLTFDQALAEAKKTNKVVFIDFYTTWCGPCKMLDRITFKDENVIKLLREKSVAIKIDAEKERDLAARYGVASYPSLLAVKPDGSEIGRVLGFREPKQFLVEVADLFQGITALERARLDVQNEGKNDPMKHHRLADEYANAGKFDDALREYLWCFDQGLTADPAYAGIRSSYLLARLAQLSQFHPPTRAAVLERRDEAARRLVENPQDRIAAMDFAAINRQFGESAQTLEMFDRLRDSNRWDAGVRLVLRDALFDDLYAKQRFGDLLAGDPVQEVEHDVERLKQMSQAFERDPLSGRMLRQRTLLKWSRLLHATLSTQPIENAQRLARTILAYDSSDETIQLLVSAAEKAGKPEFAQFIRNPAGVPATTQPQ